MSETPKYTMNAVDSHRWIKPAMPAGVNSSAEGDSNCSGSGCYTNYCGLGECPSVIRPFYALAEDGGAYLTTPDGLIYYLPPTSDKMKLIYPENHERSATGKSEDGTTVNFTDELFHVVVRPSLSRVVPWRPGSTKCMVTYGTDSYLTENVTFSGRSEYARGTTPKGNGNNIQGGLTQPFSNGYYCVQTDYDRCVVFYRDQIIYQGAYSGMGTPTPFYYALSCCNAGKCCPSRTTSIHWDYHIFPKWKKKSDGQYETSSLIDKYVEHLSVDQNGLMLNVIKRVEKDGVFESFAAVGGYCLSDLDGDKTIQGTVYNFAIYDIAQNKLVGYAVVASAENDSVIKGTIASVTTETKTDDEEEPDEEPADPEDDETQDGEEDSEETDDDNEEEDTEDEDEEDDDEDEEDDEDDEDESELFEHLKSVLVGNRVVWSLLNNEIFCGLKSDENIVTVTYDCEYEGVFRCEYDETSTDCGENERGGAPGRVFWYSGTGYNESGSDAVLWVSRWREEMCASCEPSEKNTCECKMGDGHTENIYTTDNNCKYQHPDTARICGKCNYPVTIEGDEPVWRHRTGCEKISVEDRADYKKTWKCKALLAKARLAMLGGRIESLYHSDGSESDWAYISVGSEDCRTKKDYTVIGPIDAEKGPEKDGCYLPGYFYDKKTGEYTFSASAADAVVLRAPASVEGDFIKTRSVGFPKGDAYTIIRTVERSDPEEITPTGLKDLLAENLEGYYFSSRAYCSQRKHRIHLEWQDKAKKRKIITEEVWLDEKQNEKKRINTETDETTETGRYTIKAESYNSSKHRWEEDEDSASWKTPTLLTKTYQCNTEAIIDRENNSSDKKTTITPLWYFSEDNADEYDCEGQEPTKMSGSEMEESGISYVESLLFCRDYDDRKEMTVTFEPIQWGLSEKDVRVRGEDKSEKDASATGTTTIVMGEKKETRSGEVVLRTVVTTTIVIKKTLSLSRTVSPGSIFNAGDYPDASQEELDQMRSEAELSYIKGLMIDGVGHGEFSVTEDVRITRVTTETKETEKKPGEDAETEDPDAVETDPIEVRERFVRFFPAYLTHPSYLPELNQGTKKLNPNWTKAVTSKGCASTGDIPDYHADSCQKETVSSTLSVDDAEYSVGMIDKNPPEYSDEVWKFAGFVNKKEGSTQWYAKWIDKSEVQEENGEDNPDDEKDEDTPPNPTGGQESFEEALETPGIMLKELPRPLGVCDDKTYASVDKIKSPEAGKWYCLGPALSESAAFTNYGGSEESDLSEYTTTSGIKWVQAVSVWGDPDGLAIRGGTQVGDIYYKLGSVSDDSDEPDEEPTEPEPDVKFETLVEGSDRYWYWNGYSWRTGGSYFSDIDGEKVIFYKDKGNLNRGVGDTDTDSSEDSGSEGTTIQGRKAESKCEYSKAIFAGKARGMQVCGDILAVNLNSGDDYHEAVFYKEKPIWDRPAHSKKAYPGQKELLRCLGSSYTVLVYNIGENRQRLCIWYHPYGIDSLEPKTTYAAEFSYDEVPDIAAVTDRPVTQAVLGKFGAEKVAKKYLVAISRNQMKLYLFYEGKLKKVYNYPSDFRVKEDMEAMKLSEGKFYSMFPTLGEYLWNIKQISSVFGPRYCPIRRQRTSSLSAKNLKKLAKFAAGGTTENGVCSYYDIWKDGECAESRFCIIWLNGAFLEFGIHDSENPVGSQICSDIVANKLLCMDTGQTFLLSVGSSPGVSACLDTDLLQKAGLSGYCADIPGFSWDATFATLVNPATYERLETNGFVDECVYLVADTKGAEGTFKSIPNYTGWIQKEYPVGAVVRYQGHLYRCVCDWDTWNSDESHAKVSGGQTEPLAYPDRLTDREKYTYDGKLRCCGEIWQKMDAATCDIEIEYYCIRWNIYTETVTVEPVNIKPKQWYDYSLTLFGGVTPRHYYKKWSATLTSAGPVVHSVTNGLPAGTATGISVSEFAKLMSSVWYGNSAKKVPVLYVSVIEGASPAALFIYSAEEHTARFIDLSYALPNGDEVFNLMLLQTYGKFGFSGGTIDATCEFLATGGRSCGASIPTRESNYFIPITNQYTHEPAACGCISMEADTFMASTLYYNASPKSFYGIGHHYADEAKATYQISVRGKGYSVARTKRTVDGSVFETIAKDNEKQWDDPGRARDHYATWGHWYYYDAQYQAIGRNPLIDSVLINQHYGDDDIFRFHDSYTDFAVVEDVSFDEATCYVELCTGNDGKRSYPGASFDDTVIFSVGSLAPIYKIDRSGDVSVSQESDGFSAPPKEIIWNRIDEDGVGERVYTIDAAPKSVFCSDTIHSCGSYFATGVISSSSESVVDETAPTRVNGRELFESERKKTTKTTKTEWTVYHLGEKLPISFKREIITVTRNYNHTTETISSAWYVGSGGSWTKLFNISEADPSSPLFLNCCKYQKDKALANYAPLIDGSIWYKNKQVTKLNVPWDVLRTLNLSCCGDGVLLRYQPDSGAARVMVLINGTPVEPFSSAEDWQEDKGYDLKCCGYDYYLLKAEKIGAGEPESIWEVQDDTTNDDGETVISLTVNRSITRTLENGQEASVAETNTLDVPYTVHGDDEEETVHRYFEYPVWWKTKIGDTEIRFRDDKDYLPIANYEYKQDRDPTSVITEQTVRYVPWRRPIIMRDCETYVYYKTKVISRDPRIEAITCFREKNVNSGNNILSPEYHATAAYAIFYDNPRDTTFRVEEKFDITKPGSTGSDGNVGSPNVRYYSSRWEGTAVQNILGVKETGQGYDAKARILYDSSTVQVQDSPTGCAKHAVTGEDESDQDTFCATKGKIKESQKNTCMIVWAKDECQTRSKEGFHDHDNPLIPYWDGKSGGSSSYGTIEGVTGGKTIEELRQDVIYINDYNAAGRWDRVSGDDPVDNWISDDDSFNSNPFCAGVGGLFTSAPAYHTQRDPDNDNLDKNGRLIVSGNNTLYVFDESFGRKDYSILTGKEIKY